jgi:hypothetical protein
MASGKNLGLIYHLQDTNVKIFMNAFTIYRVNATLITMERMRRSYWIINLRRRNVTNQILYSLAHSQEDLVAINTNPAISILPIFSSYCHELIHWNHTATVSILGDQHICNWPLNHEPFLGDYKTATLMTGNLLLDAWPGSHWQYLLLCSRNPEHIQTTYIIHDTQNLLSWIYKV